jgi:hypothetical protein
MNTVPIYTLVLPDYSLEKKPDYKDLGHKIDKFIEQKFFNQEIAIRGISLADHPHIHLEELTQTIIKLGTDKYDPDRKSFWHEWEVYKNKSIEMFASKCKIGQNFHFSAEMLEDFFEGAKLDRGYGIKLDLLIIYDPTKLNFIPIQHDDGVEECAWKFKYPDKKPEALLGIIQLKNK